MSTLKAGHINDTVIWRFVACCPQGSCYDKVGPIEGCYTKENRERDNKGWLRRVENMS